jgi:hypothetical protein
VRTREANFVKRCPVGSQFVGDDNRRNEALASKEFAEQPQCCDLVALGLNEDFKNLAFAVDGAPHVHLLSRGPHDPGIGLALRAMAVNLL